MSRFREPFPWEPQLQLREPSPEAMANAAAPVALPLWGMGEPTGGEHPNARHAIDDIARRWVEEARSQGNEANYDEGLRRGRKAAYRHDDRNN